MSPLVIWTIMPFIDLWEMTEQAARDVLAQQEIDTRLLLINNGSSSEARAAAESFAASSEGRVLLWSHVPPLPTLDATWNAALRFVWEAGGHEAWVVNNDVRLHPTMLKLLHRALTQKQALFVSGVGVTREQFEEHELESTFPTEAEGHGGPDFSCFLLHRVCHEKYQFDEQFTYHGDNDYHRQLILGGDGERIFSVNVPYLHLGSRTINRTPEAAGAYRKVFEAHRAKYVEKWGGLPQQEKFTRPYDPTSAV